MPPTCNKHIIETKLSYCKSPPPPPLCLFASCLPAVSHDSPTSFRLSSTDLRYVIFGLPFLHLPWGVLLFTLARLLFGIRRTCLSHLTFFSWYTKIGSGLQHLNRSSFHIFSGQKIILMHRKHFVWNVSNFLQLSFIIHLPSLRSVEWIDLCMFQ